MVPALTARKFGMMPRILFGCWSGARSADSVTTGEASLAELDGPEPSGDWSLCASTDAESADSAKASWFVSVLTSCATAVAHGADSRIANNPNAAVRGLHNLIDRNSPPDRSYYNRPLFDLRQKRRRTPVDGRGGLVQKFAGSARLGNGELPHDRQSP